MVKVSELAPATSALLAQLVPKYLDSSAYAIVTGAVAETARLLDLKWAHIFFTGSTAVGRIVATAAAKFITPCTLELGSKSPVLIDAKFEDMDLAAKRILNGKGLNCGQVRMFLAALSSSPLILSTSACQVCVSPDYVLVPVDRMDEAVASFKKMHNVLWPRSQLDPATEWSKIINLELVRLDECFPKETY